MAEPHPRQPTPPPSVPPNPPFTSGVPGFDDTFFGPNDKRYLDRKAKDVARIRGTDAYYYKMLDQTQRIDGTRPLTDGPEVVPEITTRRRSGNLSLYGEPVIIGHRIDSTKREVIPDWQYAEPVLLRAVALQPVKEEEPDERGTIVITKLKLDIARILLDEAGVIPRAGDVIRLPKLLDSFYDVEHVEANRHRFGSFGYFIAYSFDLARKTLYVPERKLDGGT